MCSTLQGVADDEYFFAHSNVGRELVAAVKISLKTGRQEVLFEDKNVDVRNIWASYFVDNIVWASFPEGTVASSLFQ